MKSDNYSLLNDGTASSSEDEVPQPTRKVQSPNTQPTIPTPDKPEPDSYPSSVWYILGNEFCERFSYYGMHTILVLYLTNMLHMSNDRATSIYHAFNMFCYFSPLLGAIIADSCLGKFRTILYVSIIYGLGNIIVAITAIPSILNAVELSGPMIGLFLIALGTGGIKPCVSAFGGDQFGLHQQHLLESFFSIFYFAINFGSLLSMIVTPMLRGDVTCFGNDCYSLAFGVPAALMIVAIIVFIAGSPRYKKNPPTGNIVWEVITCLWFGARRRFSSVGRKIPKEHWLDWAEEKYGKEMVNDVKALLRVLFMFIPLPVFWTLFDQQGSRWVLQAEELDGHVHNWFTVKPDQMQALNPVFILILIPIFERIIYPLLRKCGFALRPLQRMCAGMALAACAFLLAAFLQLKIQSLNFKVPSPPPGRSNLRFINAARCSVNVTSAQYPTMLLHIPQRSASNYMILPSYVKDIHIKADKCPKDPTMQYFNHEKDLSFSLVPRTSQIYVISNEKGRFNGTMFPVTFLDSIKSGRSHVRFIHAAPNVAPKLSIKVNSSLTIDNITAMNSTDYLSMSIGRYDMEILDDKNVVVGKQSLEFLNSGMYTVIVQRDPESLKVKLVMEQYVDVGPKMLSMFCQIPQYLIITAGEVMFSITGLEFAYSQSPVSMKSCIMAAWLLTVSFGNLIVVIFAEARFFFNMANEFFFFSGLLFAVVIIFAIMSQFYVYVSHKISVANGDSDDDDDHLLDDDEGETTFD